jgi:hypothetical protein
MKVLAQRALLDGQSLQSTVLQRVSMAVGRSRGLPGALWGQHPRERLRWVRRCLVPARRRGRMVP